MSAREIPAASEQPPETAEGVAALKAQLTLKGHSVHRLAEGGFQVTRWGQVRRCDDLAALQAFAEQVGAKS